MRVSPHTLRRYGAYSLAAAMLLLALLLSVIRFGVLPRAAGQRPELERQIGQLIGETVSIGSVSARLRGLYPELVLGDFRIIDTNGRAGIRFEQVQVGIHPLESLVSGRVAPVWAKIHGTRLSARRRADGSLAVLGLNVLDHPPAWLLAAEHIELLDSHIDWQDERQERPPTDLGHADLRLANAGDRHQLSISTRWRGGEAGGLLLRADLAGDLFKKDAWGGRIYLEGTRLSAARLTGLFPDLARLQSGSAGFRIWSDWLAGSMTRLAGRIELRQPSLMLAHSSRANSPMKLAGLESWFRWRESGADALLELDGLRVISTSAQQAPASRVALGWSRDDGGRIASWRAAASRLRLQDLAALAEAVPMVSDDARGVIRESSLQGQVRDLSVVYRTDSASGPRFAFCGDVAGASLRAHHAVPGLSRIEGRFCGSDRSGSLELRSTKSDLAAPSLWRAPIRLDQAELAARWRRVGDALRIESSRFGVATADFSIRGGGAVELASDPASSPLLDLQLAVSDCDVLGAKRYLPERRFPEASHYLESALLGGRIARADVRIQGPMARFPFEKGGGAFEAVLDFRKMDVLYHPHWPPLRAIDGKLVLSGTSLEFDAVRGRIGNGEISRLKATVPSLIREPRLGIDATVRASVADTMDFMSASPLRGIPEALLQFASWSGDVEFGIGLTAPLTAGWGDVRVTGSAALKEGRVASKAIDLALDALAGSLTFTGTELKSVELAGEFLHEPVTFTAADRGATIEIGAEGRARTSTLARVFRSDLWRILDGEAAYRLKVVVPNASEPAPLPVIWTFGSDLRGVAVRLPDPVGKVADAAGLLELSGRVESANRVPVRLSYAGILQASLTGSAKGGRWQLEQGDFAWGRELPSRPVSGDLRFVGRFPRIEARDWTSFLAGFGGDDGAWRQQRLEADFETRELRWSGQHLGAVKLNMTKEPARCQGTIDGDLGAGRFVLRDEPNRYSSLYLDLDRLRIPHGSGHAEQEGQPAAIDVRTLPNISLRSRKTLWQDVDIGSLSLDADRQSLGLVLRKGELQGDRHRLVFAGDWLASAGKSRMRLNGQATADSLGELAARLGAGGKIQDTRSALDFQLSWAGSPVHVRLPALEGEIGIRMEEGSLLDFDPGWGRMIGFLNLNSIWRRINLDFRDLVNQGLSYDRIEGRFRLADGQATTSGFLIEGVATRIVIDGSADLKAKTLNQTVTVIPRTSVALPIAGTLAGGPAVGAAIFVAQELVGEHVDSITATRYRASGPWDNPTLQKVDGNLPIEMLGRAWSGLKRLSGSDEVIEDKGK